MFKGRVFICSSHEPQIYYQNKHVKNVYTNKKAENEFNGNRFSDFIFAGLRKRQGLHGRLLTLVYHCVRRFICVTTDASVA